MAKTSRTYVVAVVRDDGALDPLLFSVANLKACRKWILDQGEGTEAYQPIVLLGPALTPDITMKRDATLRPALTEADDVAD